MKRTIAAIADAFGVTSSVLNSLYGRVARLKTMSRSELLRAARRRLRMLFGLAFLVPRWRQSPLYLSFVPDSVYMHLKHAELYVLAKSFCKHNNDNRGDLSRLIAMALNIKQALSEDVAGDFAELGVWRGNTAAILAHYAAEAGRKLILFDTFTGFDRRDLTGIDKQQGLHFADTSKALVASVVGHNDNVEYVKGYFPDTITTNHSNRRYAIVSIDCDLYIPMKAGLEFFYPRMAEGGILLLHDYSNGSWHVCAKAIDEFCAATGERVVLIPDKAGSAFIRKSKTN